MNAYLLRSPIFWMRVVGLVVVVSLGLALARLTWRLTGWDDGRAEVWTPTALAPVSGMAGGDLAAILAWNPFGGGAAGLDGLPISNLGLVLRGVIYAVSGGSTALIANGPGPVQVFGVGQAPIGNAVIEAIEVDRVILNVGGRREVLLLPKPTESATGAPASTGVAAPPSAPAAAAPGPSPEAQAALAASSPIATAAAANRPASPQTAPAVAPAAAIASLGITPSGQGYVIGADSAPQLLRAGLRPGDVIRSVNGASLGDPDADRQIFERAAAGGRVRVEVVRDGRTLTLTVPLR